MVRKIIKIDRERCNGCSACVSACHEGAIEMVDGKAKLTRESYCDGLGDCLPACPTGAISFEMREAPEYDEAAVLRSKRKSPCSSGKSGCPGSRAKLISPHTEINEVPRSSSSRLMQWPCQIKLVPAAAPYFDGARLLIAADCTAYAYANLHEEFMKGHVTLIGCPKLDGCDYAEKLTQILKLHEIKSVTVVRMEVPCCGGIENAVKRALMSSGKLIPWQIVTISTDGKILN